MVLGQCRIGVKFPERFGAICQCCVEIELRQEAADEDVDAGGGFGISYVDGESINGPGAFFGSDFPRRQTGDGNGIDVGEFERLRRVDEMTFHGFALRNAQGDHGSFFTDE